MKWLGDHLSGILEKVLATLTAAGITYLFTLVPKVGPLLMTRLSVPLWVLLCISIATAIMVAFPFLYTRSRRPGSTTGLTGELRVGVKARIIDDRLLSDLQRRETPGWVEEMNQYSGRECLVTRVTSDGWVKLEGIPCDFRKEWVQAVSVGGPSV